MPQEVVAKCDEWKPRVGDFSSSEKRTRESCEGFPWRIRSLSLDLLRIPGSRFEKANIA